MLLCLTLVGCGQVPTVYSTEDFEITIPSNWIIEEDTAKLPNNIEVAFLSRDSENNLIYSVNITRENFEDIEIDNDEFLQETIEKVSKEENYALISDDEISLGDHDSIIHVFKTTQDDVMMTFIQSYILDVQRQESFVVTATMPINTDEIVFSTLEDIVKSFRIIMKEDKQAEETE